MIPENERNLNPSTLRLKYLKPGLAAGEREALSREIDSIEAHRKYRNKFPTLFAENPEFRVASLLACEQASHEWVAKYHASLAQGFSSLTDLTAGFGIDFIYMSRAILRNGEGCLALELDKAKAECLRENVKDCGLTSAEVIKCDSIKYLAENTCTNCDRSGRLIYVDPARRGEGDKRLYDPADCTPDIIANFDLLAAHANRIIVKNSPFLDIDRAATLLPGVTEIHIVSVKNECKEVLMIIDTDIEKSREFPRLFCVNIIDEEDVETFAINADNRNLLSGSDVTPPICERVDDLVTEKTECIKMYVPNASVMKAGVYGRNALLGKYAGLKRLSPNCNVYIAERMLPYFPGKIFGIKRIVGKSEMKSLRGKEINVAVRNYPMRADKLADKLKVKSSPNASEFIYGVTLGHTEAPLLLQVKAINV